MDPQYEPWIWLAVTLVGAVLVDYTLVRFLLDIVRPATAYVFWIGRAGKLIALLSWCALFNQWWFPNYISDGAPVPSMALAAQWSVAGVMLLLAITTYPRASFGKAARDA